MSIIFQNNNKNISLISALASKKVLDYKRGNLLNWLVDIQLDHFLNARAKNREIVSLVFWNIKDTTISFWLLVKSKIN